VPFLRVQHLGTSLIPCRTPHTFTRHTIANRWPPIARAIVCRLVGATPDCCIAGAPRRTFQVCRASA